jgi:hypothetical protein
VIIGFFPTDLTSRVTDRQEILLFGRTVDNSTVCLIDRWSPSFHVLDESGEEAVRYLGQDAKARKVVCRTIKEMHELAQSLRNEGKTVCGHDLDISNKYLLEKSIVPFTFHEAEIETATERLGDITARLSHIRQITSETLSGHNAIAIACRTETGFPDSPVISASVAGQGFTREYTWKKELAAEGTELLTGEVELLETLAQMLKSQSADVIVGFGSDEIDMQAIAYRGQRYGIPFSLGRDGTGIKISKGRYKASITGIAHADMERYATSLGMSCERSARSIYGFYQMLLPGMLELVKLTKCNIDCISRSTDAQLIEQYLISLAPDAAELVPPKPNGKEYDSRQRQYPRLLDDFTPGVFSCVRSMDLSYLLVKAMLDDSDAFFCDVIGSLRERADRINEMQRGGIDRLLNIRLREINRLKRAFATYFAYPAARWYSLQAYTKALEKARQTAKGIRHEIMHDGAIIGEDNLLLYWTGSHCPSACRSIDRAVFMSDKPFRGALLNDGELSLIRLPNRCSLLNDIYSAALPLIMAGKEEDALAYLKEILSAVKRRQISPDKLADISTGLVQVRGDGPPSERQRKPELAADYDEVYYSNYILMPALESLVQIMGKKKEDLLQPKEQSRLEVFF